MPDAKDTPLVLDETHLMSMGISESGWSGDRARIPEPIVVEIKELLKGHLAEDQFRSFLADLDRGFANAVEMAWFQNRLRGETVDLACLRKWKKPVPVKLGVFLRDYIRNLRLVLERAPRRKPRIKLDQFIRDIERFPVLERLVTIQLEEAVHWETADPLRTNPAKAAEHLPDVLLELENSISAGIKRGPSKAALTYLAGFFVNSYHFATGKIPGRTWDAYKETETGAGLEICRLLAQELNELLRKEDQSEQPPDMAKPYRKAIEALHGNAPRSR